MKYDNATYWLNIHKQYKDELRAVGHPKLSEFLNRLKYRSEATTILTCLQEIAYQFRKAERKVLSLLDIGAGTGYWSDLACRFFTEQGFILNVTAVDISRDALNILSQRNSNVKAVCEDLKTINPDRFRHTFDLVLSCYCLHHLVNVDDFLNALRFSGRSVTTGGFLMIMDPVLTMPFSRFDVIDFFSYAGNGIPRHLYLIEDVLGKEGLRRHAVWPAVSFLLNGNIQGYGPLSYSLTRLLWKVLRILYQSDYFVRVLSGVLTYMDGALKRLNLAFSSSVCIYVKSSSEDLWKK